MSYGPKPWQQRHWDWRAAANFMCGGAGAGLIALAPFIGTQGLPLQLAMLGGVALIGLGLLCVWAEIGRPWRALNVFFNPRTSWMTREAIVATVLVPLAVMAAAGVGVSVWLAAAAALAFVYCQSRILKAAKGIPTWRTPMIVPLIVATGLAEGAGLWLVLQPLQILSQPPLLILVTSLLLARALLWPLYRSRLGQPASSPARRVLDLAGRSLLWIGSVLPLTLLALAASASLPPMATAAVAALAGGVGMAAGLHFKHALITRAAFNQGFALTRLPVRGVRR